MLKTDFYTLSTRLKERRTIKIERNLIFKVKYCLTKYYINLPRTS